MLAVPSEDFRHHTLATNLAQIALLEAVLLHQKPQRLDASSLWQRVLRGLKVFDQIADAINQAHRGMFFIAACIIEQRLEQRHHPPIVRCIADRGDIGGAAKGFPRGEQVFDLDWCVHDFHLPLSYSRWVSTALM